MQWLPYHFVVSIQHNYAEIRQSLAHSHALADPAEAHGQLTGALCALVLYRMEGWLAEILPDDSLVNGTVPLLLTLYNATVAALSGGEMDFDLLIPGDDCPIEERT